MIAKRTSLKSNVVINYSLNKNLIRRCAVVFYRGGPSQASRGDDSLGRGWPGAEKRASAQPEEEPRAVSGRVSSVHGCIRGWAVVIRYGGSTTGAGRRREDGESGPGESDCSCPDQDGQAGFEDAGHASAGRADSGDLSKGGVEPAGRPGGEDPGLLDAQTNGSQEQDPGAFGSAEGGCTAGSGKAGEGTLRREGAGVLDRVVAGGPGQEGFGRPAPGIQRAPSSYQEVGRTRPCLVWRDRGSVPNRQCTGFCYAVVGLGGGRNRRRQEIFQAGGSSFLCWRDPFDLLLGV